MAAAIDGFRERWERMNPREQRLMAALGITLVICIIAAMVFSVQNGMADLEKKNKASRQALLALKSLRISKASTSSAGKEIAIPDKALELDTYIERIVKEIGVESPTYPKLKSDEKGNHVELSFPITLKGLTIVQLKDFLEKVESGSELVVVKELKIDRNFRDKETLDLEVTIATYKTKAAEAEEESKNDEGGDEG